MSTLDEKYRPNGKAKTLPTTINVNEVKTGIKPQYLKSKIQ